MWTLILATLIGLIASLCIYGKKIIDKAFNVLAIILLTAVVSLTTVSLVKRSSLNITDVLTDTYDISSMWLVDSLLVKPSTFPMIKDSSWRITDQNARDLHIRPIFTITSKTDTSTKTEKRFGSNSNSYYVLYLTAANDTAIGYIYKENGKFKTDYWTIREPLKIAPISENNAADKPRVEKVKLEYDRSDSKWVEPTLFTKLDSYVCIYLPQKQYDNLPENVKKTCAFESREEYLKSAIAEIR